MHSRQRAWCATAIGVGGLVVFALAYWFTYEPAPSVRVSWRPGTTIEQQQALERKYMLANRRAPMSGSLAYDLLDTTHANIDALLKDPAVVDSNDIDDQWARVRLGTAYDDEWMWVADRTPLLRDVRIRWALLATLAVTAVVGMRGLLRPRTGRTRG